MSLEGILVGLLAIAIGLAWAFYGLKLFVILLPIWAFFFGLVTGAQWASEVFGKGDAGFFITTLSWIIGIVFGLVLAAIAFFWYYAAVVIMVGALGYMLGVGFFEWLGFGTGLIALVVGLLLGAVFAVAAFLLGVPALLVVVVSAFSGAAAVVNGVGILLGRHQGRGAEHRHLRLAAQQRGRRHRHGRDGPHRGCRDLVSAAWGRGDGDGPHRSVAISLRLVDRAAVARRGHRPGNDEQPLHPLRPERATGRQPPAGTRPDHAATRLGRARCRRDPRARADLHPGRVA